MNPRREAALRAIDCNGHVPANVIQLAAGPPCPECERRVLHLPECMTGAAHEEARILEEAAEIAARRRPELGRQLRELADAKRQQVIP